MTLLTFGIRPRPPISGHHLQSDHPIVSQTLARAAEAASEPFIGLTTDGSPVRGLFSIGPTGVSTAPMREAASAFLGTLDDRQRAVACFPLADPNWQRWNNTHPFILRHGLLLEELDPTRRERALDVLRSACSVRGFEGARNVMKLNETVAELTGKRDEYGEWLYWISFFGSPSADEPWGWQVDGHHLNVNCLVLGDQVALTPMFEGSEPTEAPSGKYAGTRVFEAEEQVGLAFVRSLSAAQQERTILFPSTNHAELPPERWHPTEGRIQARALRDNLVLAYEGLPGAEMSAAQRQGLLDLVNVYVGRMREGHDRVKMAEVERHLDQTHVVWFGGTADDSTFYYRVHSPVVMIEFDHLRGIAFDNDEPARTHIHTVVRTPNGNDYGKDLLRQHYAQHHASRPPGV